MGRAHLNIIKTRARYGQHPARSCLRAIRVVVGLVGAGAALQGAIMFAWPDAVIDAWPWPQRRTRRRSTIAA